MISMILSLIANLWNTNGLGVWVGLARHQKALVFDELAVRLKKSNFSYEYGL